MKKVFGRTCLFLLASTFLFQNAGFLTHELNFAFGLMFLLVLGIFYLPIQKKGVSAYEIALGIALIVVAIAVMPGEFLRPGAVALFLLALGVLRGSVRDTPELPLFAMTAAGYGFYMFLYRADAFVWAWVKGLSFGFSRLVAGLTSALPGVKALLGPTFLGAGTIVTFALFFIIGSFFLRQNRLRKAVNALATMVVLTGLYVLIFTYLPSLFEFQLKLGPVPSEAEKSEVRQAEEAHRELKTRTDSEKATRVIFSADAFVVDNCALWAPVLLVLLFLIPTHFFLKGAELRAAPLSGSIPLSAAGVALLIALAFLETGALRVGSRDKLKETIATKRVGLYYPGFSNWMRPSFQNFGSRSSGMFGNLPDFVEAMGFNQPLPTIDPESAVGRALIARDENVRAVKIVNEKGEEEQVWLSRNQEGYINAGVLLMEITEESLKDIDILMLLNASDMFNREDPPRGVEASRSQTARKKRLAECGSTEEQIELMEQWHEEALELIWKFVANGGALLVLGDHTFYKQADLPGGRVSTRLWLNEVLEPFDMKFVNDSAKYFIGGWLHSLENPLHSLTNGIRDDHNEVGMVTGASLAVSGAARPVIVGKYGYLDAGDMREGGRGFLGNMDYDTGEPLGEIIIAAEQSYGEGKVIAFGDTGAFANGIITNTGEFCNRVFAWLAARSGDPHAPDATYEHDFDPHKVPARSGATTTALALLLLAGAIVCVRYSGGHAGVVAGALAVGLMVAAHPSDTSVPLGPGKHDKLRIAYVDNYHLPKACKEGWREDGMMATHLNLMRNGFYTQNLKRFDKEILDGADLLVIPCPSVRFSRADVRTVRQMVKNGATVIVTSGHEDIAATQPLLDAFGLKIRYAPLGRFKFPLPEADRRYVPFWTVWPIEYTGADAANGDGADEEKDDLEVIIPYEPVRGNRPRRLVADNHLEAPPKQTSKPEQAPAEEAAGPEHVSDAELAEEIKAKLAADSQLKDVVAANVEDATITLTGKVADPQLKEKAQELAATVTGRAGILNNVVVDPRTVRLRSTSNPSDGAAAREMRAKLRADRELRAEPIEFTVKNGVIKLTGTVSSRALKEKAAALAQTVSYAYSLGVKRNYGKGSFILIADSGFWLNKNLEVEKMNDMSELQKADLMHSIEFIEWLLKTHVPKAKESK